VRYRFVLDLPEGRIRKGMVRDYSKSVISSLERRTSLPAWRFCIPEHLGEHFSEKPSVELVEIEDSRSPLPVPSREEAGEGASEGARIQAQQKRNVLQSEFNELEEKIDEMRTRLRLIGGASEEAAEIESMEEQLSKLAEELAEAEGQLTTAERRLGFAERQIEEPGDFSELKTLFAKVAQYPGLLSELDRARGLRGEFLYTHGKAGYDAFCCATDALADLLNVEQITPAVLNRSDVAALVTWARENFSRHELSELPEKQMVAAG